MFQKQMSAFCFNPLTTLPRNAFLLNKKCISRSVGFFRSRLILIYTICHSFLYSVYTTKHQNCIKNDLILLENQNWPCNFILFNMRKIKKSHIPFCNKYVFNLYIIQHFNKILIFEVFMIGCVWFFHLVKLSRKPVQEILCAAIRYHTATTCGNIHNCSAQKTVPYGFAMPWIKSRIFSTLILHLFELLRHAFTWSMKHLA